MRIWATAPRTKRRQRSWFQDMSGFGRAVGLGLGRGRRVVTRLPSGPTVGLRVVLRSPSGPTVGLRVVPPVGLTSNTFYIYLIVHPRKTRIRSEKGINFIVKITNPNSDMMSIQ